MDENKGKLTIKKNIKLFSFQEENKKKLNKLLNDYDFIDNNNYLLRLLRKSKMLPNRCDLLIYPRSSKKENNKINSITDNNIDRINKDKVEITYELNNILYNHSKSFSKSKKKYYRIKKENDEFLAFYRYNRNKGSKSLNFDLNRKTLSGKKINKKIEEDEYKRDNIFNDNYLLMNGQNEIYYHFLFQSKNERKNYTKQNPYKYISKIKRYLKNKTFDEIENSYSENNNSIKEKKYNKTESNFYKVNNKIKLPLNNKKKLKFSSKTIFKDKNKDIIIRNNIIKSTQNKNESKTSIENKNIIYKNKNNKNLKNLLSLDKTKDLNNLEKNENLKAINSISNKSINKNENNSMNNNNKNNNIFINTKNKKNINITINKSIKKENFDNSVNNINQNNNREYNEKGKGSSLKDEYLNVKTSSKILDDINKTATNLLNKNTPLISSNYNLSNKLNNDINKKVNISYNEEIHKNKINSNKSSSEIKCIVNKNKNNNDEPIKKPNQKDCKLKLKADNKILIKNNIFNHKLNTSINNEFNNKKSNYNIINNKFYLKNNEKINDNIKTIFPIKQQLNLNNKNQYQNKKNSMNNSIINNNKSFNNKMIKDKNNNSNKKNILQNISMNQKNNSPKINKKFDNFKNNLINNQKRKTIFSLYEEQKNKLNKKKNSIDVAKRRTYDQLVFYDLDLLDKKRTNNKSSFITDTNENNYLKYSNRKYILNYYKGQSLDTLVNNIKLKNDNKVYKFLRKQIYQNKNLEKIEDENKYLNNLDKYFIKKYSEFQVLISYADDKL